ncbi:ALP1-like protein [Tanacetum coccineum]
MNSDQFFINDTDEEDEVNSLVFGFFKDDATLLLAFTSTTPIIRRNPIVRDRPGVHDRLVAAYFVEQPMYTPNQFRKQFRMRQKLFNRIVRDLNDTYPYFQQNIDAVGRCGISTLVNCTSTIHQIAYDFVPDLLDEYLQIDTKTARDCLVNFCNGIMELYGEEYLRKPTQTNIDKLYAYHREKHKFSGLVGSIECTKWPWAQCPVGLPDQFWLNNDINVIRQSPILNDLKEGIPTEVAFVANDVHYKWGYYLTNAIYP